MRELKQRWRRRQRERKKRCRLAKQQLCTWITLFCKFHCRLCTTTTWKCLISRTCGRREQKATFFFFPKLQYSLVEFNSRKFANIERVGISALKLEIEKAEIDRLLSLRSLRSLESGFHMIAMIAAIADWTFFSQRSQRSYENQD